MLRAILKIYFFHSNSMFCTKVFEYEKLYMLKYMCNYISLQYCTELGLHLKHARVHGCHLQNKICPSPTKYTKLGKLCTIALDSNINISKSWNMMMITHSVLLISPLLSTNTLYTCFSLPHSVSHRVLASFPYHSDELKYSRKLLQTLGP